MRALSLGGGALSTTRPVRGGIIAQAPRSLGGVCSSQRILPPQMLQGLLVDGDSDRPLGTQIGSGRGDRHFQRTFPLEPPGVSQPSLDRGWCTLQAAGAPQDGAHPGSRTGDAAAVPAAGRLVRGARSTGTKTMAMLCDGASRVS